MMSCQKQNNINIETLDIYRIRRKPMSENLKDIEVIIEEEKIALRFDKEKWIIEFMIPATVTGKIPVHFTVGDEE